MQVRPRPISAHSPSGAPIVAPVQAHHRRGYIRHNESLSPPRKGAVRRGSISSDGEGRSTADAAGVAINRARRASSPYVAGRTTNPTRNTHLDYFEVNHAATTRSPVILTKRTPTPTRERGRSRSRGKAAVLTGRPYMSQMERAVEDAKEALQLRKRPIRHLYITFAIANLSCALLVAIKQNNLNRNGSTPFLARQPIPRPPN